MMLQVVAVPKIKKTNERDKKIRKGKGYTDQKI